MLVVRSRPGVSLGRKGAQLLTWQSWRLPPRQSGLVTQGFGQHVHIFVHASNLVSQGNLHMTWVLQSTP